MRGLPSRFIRRRKGENKFRTDSHFALHVDRTAGLLDDSIYDTQSQSGALRLGGDVGVKHLAEELTLKSRAIVTHAHHGVFGLGAALELGRDLERGTLDTLQRLQGVGHQVVEDLPYPAAVGLDARQALIQAKADARARRQSWRSFQASWPWPTSTA